MYYSETAFVFVNIYFTTTTIELPNSYTRFVRLGRFLNCWSQSGLRYSLRFTFTPTKNTFQHTLSQVE